MPEENYPAKAEEDARDAVAYFLDDIVKEIIEKENEIGTSILDWSETYHHESHVDKSYSLLEAATLLDQLDDFEETDSGLWEGQSPRDAIATQAAFTYGNAVAAEFTELMEKINETVSDADIFMVVAEDDEERRAEILDREIRMIIWEAVKIGEPPLPKGVKEWRPGEPRKGKKGKQ
jgi:hypothetical protein